MQVVGAPSAASIDVGAIDANAHVSVDDVAALGQIDELVRACVRAAAAAVVVLAAAAAWQTSATAGGVLVHARLSAQGESTPLVGLRAWRTR